VKFKLDENIPATVAELLAHAGHDAQTVAREGLKGSNDAAVLQAAQSESRLLLTLDKGIADLRSHQLSEEGGVVVFRLADESAPRINQAVRRILDGGGFEKMRGCLAVVRENRIRIRKRSTPPAH
jgi:predicted nuclease of predicted toxin-antitoxin system